MNPRRAFDLRYTALFFGLLAAVVSLVGLTARTAISVAEQRPVWAVVLGVPVLTAALLLQRRRRHPLSVARTARKATAALDEATRTALDVLDHEPSPGPAPAASATADGPLVVSAGRTDPQEAPAASRSAEEAVTPTPDVATAPPTGPVDLETLDPDEFEQVTAALCERDGCTEVEVVGGAGDLGADVMATAPDGRRVVIQCKRYGDTNRVGSQDLQRFGGTCFTVHGADVAIVVTTSGFTAPALEYAEQCGIVCWDREDLQAWSDGTGPEPWRPRTPETAYADPQRVALTSNRRTHPPHGGTTARWRQAHGHDGHDQQWQPDLS
ncbi:restriction endonuclease [Streptomyces sp. NPDC051104]|uniref:restriction endonuclease n=1 Tax=Streptomyces sp. NPDC051104 TaxID=3155044 RepID=UPI00342BCA23